MVAPTSFVMTAAKQSTLTIPIWDAGTIGLNMADSATTFNGNSIDAVMSLKNSVTAFTSAKGAFVVSGATMKNFTTGRQCNYNRSLGSTQLPWVYLNGRFWVFNTFLFDIFNPDTALLGYGASTPLLSPNAVPPPSKFYSGTNFPCNEFDAGAGAMPVLHMDQFGILGPGAIYGTAGTWKMGIFSGAGAGAGGFGINYALSQSQLSVSFYSRQNFFPSFTGGYILGRYNSTYITIHPMGPGLTLAYTVILDDPAYQGVNAGRSICPWGFLMRNNNPLNSQTIILSPDGSKYWPVVYAPQTAAALGALTIGGGSADVKIDGNGTCWIANQGGGAGGYVGNNLKAFKPQLWMDSRPIQGAGGLPLASISLPCNDYCRNPPISIGRKI